MSETVNIDALLVPPVEDLGYEQAFALLEEIVAAMENQEFPMDQALRLFERGQALSHHCAGLLDQAELRIQQISAGEIVDLQFDE